MLDIMVRMYGTPSIYLGKLLFAQILGKWPESSRPIRLLHFQNDIISIDCLTVFLKLFVSSLSTMRGKHKYFGGN